MAWLLLRRHFVAAFEAQDDILEQQVTRASGDSFVKKLALDNLGAVYVKLRDYGQAIDIYERALALAREVGDRQHEADMLWILAIQHAELGHPDQAVAKAQTAIWVYEELGAPNTVEFKETLRVRPVNPLLD
jgi:tetratricopeptide (TPR) repeat protein